MFAIGEYVACRNKGVCVVEDISTLNISGIDKNRQYYILKPVYQTSSTVYLPIDASETSVRAVLKEAEAKALLEEIPYIPTLTIVNEKQSEQTYKECMKTGDCKEWVKVIKTIYSRNSSRLKAGKKRAAVDEKYSHIVEDSLFGELAVALNIPKTEVEEYIVKNALLSE